MSGATLTIPAGYKLTEVGVIPEDWRVYPLGEIGKFKNGLNKDSTAFGHGLPFVNLMDVFGVSCISAVESLGLVACSTFERSSYDLRRGDVIFVRSSVKPAGVGLTVVVESDLPETVYSGFLIRFRDNGFIDIGYKKHCFYEGAFRRAIISSSTVSANTNINQDSLKRVALVLPPTKAEQEAIAEALSDADALIESLEQIVAKKRQLKQGAMQELLTGKKRLPGFGEEWEVKRLGDICELAMGRTPPRITPEFWGRGHTWLAISDLRAKVVMESKEEITALAAAEMQIIPKGTLLMSFKLSIGRLCFAGCDLYTNEAICSFNRLKANGDFLYYALGRIDFSLYGKQAVKGYTLNSESLKLVEVKLPPRAEQTAIATILSDLDTEIATLDDKLAKARRLKQGMMQELLTGRIRLV